MAFVGRQAELGALERALGEALAGAGQFALVSGEAGIGKTRLCDELARRAAAQGATVAWGRSWEGEGTPAYWPWLQVLRSLGLEALLKSGGAAPSDGEHARFRLFDGVAASLAEKARRRPLVVILDDLHAADLSTLLLLAFVARGAKGTPLLLVGTARDSASEPLAKATREATVVPLGRLQRGELLQWVGEVAPRLADRVDAVFTTSEGNPLFIEELLATARKRPDAALGLGTTLPAGIRGAVRGHLGTLSERAQWLLEAAAVLGRELSLATLLALGEGPKDRALVDEALNVGVLHDLGEGRLRFSHVLLRDELYANIAPARRDELHRAVGRRLLAEGDAPAAVHHLVLGARREDSAEAAALVTGAVRDATARLAFEDAAALGERALAALAPHLGPRDEADLWLSVAEAHVQGGHTAAARAACARVAALADTLGDFTLSARAALCATAEVTFGRDDEGIALLRRAVDALPAGDSIVAAQLMGRLAVALAGGAPDEAEEHARLRDASLAMARRLGDPKTLLAAVGFASYFPESVPRAERLALFSEAIAVAERLGQVPRIAAMLGWRMTCFLEQGDVAGAERALAHAEQLLAPFTQPHYRWRVPMLKAGLANLQGRFAEAETLGKAARRLCDEHGIVEGLMHYATHRMTAAYNRGDSGDLEDHVPMFQRLLSRQPMAELFFAIFEAWLGQPEKVKKSFERVRQVSLATVPGPGALAWVCVHAGLAEHAAYFYDFLAPRMKDVPIMFGPGGMSSLGPNGLLLGRLAVLMGRTADAVAHFETGLAFARTIGARPFVAHTQLAWARLVPAEAPVRAREALEVAEALQMVNVAAQARALLAPTPRQARGEREDVLLLTREGELWALSGAGRRVLLKESKGLTYLEVLVRDPHREIHVLELIGAEEDSDAGPLLDAKAKHAYRERAESLQGELDEALRHADTGRAARMRDELDALATELSRAVGLGGRDRRAGSAAERARINVQRRLRDVGRRVAELDPVLGRHLELSLKTGQLCMYAPTWPAA